MLKSLNLSKFKLNSLITFEFGPKGKIQRFRISYRGGWSPGVGCFLGFCLLMDWLLLRKECSLIYETEQKPCLLQCVEGTSKGMDHGPDFTFLSVRVYVTQSGIV